MNTEKTKREMTDQPPPRPAVTTPDGETIELSDSTRIDEFRSASGIFLALSDRVETRDDEFILNQPVFALVPAPSEPRRAPHQQPHVGTGYEGLSLRVVPYRALALRRDHVALRAIGGYFNFATILHRQAPTSCRPPEERSNGQRT